MKTYVTFGWGHQHTINGKHLHKNCVAVFEAKSAKEGRILAFKLFGPKFAFEYFDTEWNEQNQLPYYPLGYVELTKEDLEC